MSIQEDARRTEKSEKHPVDQMLPIPQLAVYGFQHVLAFYAGAVIVPILLAGALQLTQEQLAYLINADLFTCGIASLIQTIGFWKIGVRLPLLQGVTFAAVSPMISIGLSEGGGTPGLQAIYGAVIVGGVFAFIIAPFFAQLIRFFPPIVTGTVISVIGVVLLGVAAADFAGGTSSKFSEPPEFGSVKNMALGAFTLLVILALYRFFKGFIATIAVLIGLFIGTIAGMIFGFTDFSHVADAAVFGVTTPFHFGPPTFSFAAILSLIIVMAITAVETTGDVFACAEIVDKKVGPADIARALRADGLATTLGGLLNSFPYTCFAENVGLVRLTGVKSRFVVATAGVFMIILGLIPKAGAIVAAIPHPVLGGAGLALFGTVAVIGIQTLRRVDFHKESNVIILAVSLGFAIMPVAEPTMFDQFNPGVKTIINSGITLGSLSAIILNLIFNAFGAEKNGHTEGAPTAAASERCTLEEVNHLSPTEFVETFSPVFQGVSWVAEKAYSAGPFADVYELRRAFHDALFSADDRQQIELIRAYPEISRTAKSLGGARVLSVMDHAMAGLDRMDTDEHQTLGALTSAYHQKFGFPLVIAVQENTKETILKSGTVRLANSPAAEQAAALVEIAKIANLRLLDRIPSVRVPEQ